MLQDLAGKLVTPYQYGNPTSRVKLSSRRRVRAAFLAAANVANPESFRVNWPSPKRYCKAGSAAMTQADVLSGIAIVVILGLLVYLLFVRRT